MINNFENLTGDLTYGLKKSQNTEENVHKRRNHKRRKKTSGWWLQEA